jgi:hypothetical protein
MSDAAEEDVIRGHKRVELVKVSPPFRDRDYFDRGERAIMVDGARWGRTHVAWHGCNGTTVTFSQEAGEEICDMRGKGEYSRAIAVSVRSMGRRDRRIWKDGRYVNNPDFKTTEELATIKAQELVDAGRLRDPQIVRKERDEAHRRWVEQRARREVEKAEAWRRRAMEALNINDPESETLARVLALMEWAKAQ